jgi:hypothetical protein
MALLATSGTSPAYHPAGRHPVAVGLAAALVTVLLFLVWQRFVSWYIFGSAFTDLPGQDSLALVNSLEGPVLALIALVSGRLAGLLCPAGRWIAALLGVSPLSLFLLVSVLWVEGNPAHAVPWCVLIFLIGMFGAYAPTWPNGRRVHLHRRG